MSDRDEVAPHSPQRVKRVLQLAGLESGPEEISILANDLPRIIGAWRVLAEAAHEVPVPAPAHNECGSILAPDLVESHFDPEIWTENLPARTSRGPWVPPNRGRE